MQNQQPLEIKIRYMHEDTRRLEFNPVGDWIDLYADATVDIKPHEHVLIPLGVAMQLPKGYEAHLAPRSSLFKNYGLLVANSIGIIDESYCGDNDEWKLSAYNTGTHITVGTEWNAIRVDRGDKIAQFRIVEKMPKVFLHEVLFLGNKDRGGFGSTGN